MSKNNIGKEDKAYIEFLARHFVALGCYQRFPSSNGHPNSFEEKYHSFSGFILSVQDEWFLITAGHIFDEVKTAIEQKCEFLDWQLDDLGAGGSASPNNFDGPPPFDTIPFSYDNAYKNHYYEEKNEIDFAFIHLEERLYRKLLLKNGIVPLDEASWKINIPDEFVKLVLLGIPSDLVYPINDSGRMHKSYVSIEVDEIKERSPKSQAHSLYGQIPDISQSGLQGFTRINGMSGGPIFGFAYNKKQELRYWIVALQSSWQPNTKEITAFRVKYIGEYLDYLITQIQLNKDEEDQSNH